MQLPRQSLQRSSASVSSNARRKLPRTKPASEEESRYVYSHFQNVLITNISGCDQVRKERREGLRGSCWGHFPDRCLLVGKTVNALFDFLFSHLPCVFEDNDIPYVFVPSKHDLGAAIGSKRPTCVLLVKPGEDYMSDFGKAIKVRALYKLIETNY